MKNGVENALPTPGGGNGKSWQLSLYDQHRTPHEPITDGTEITVSPRSLNSELMCPICLDMLKNTMTTKECLHRFCQECITTALRSGNKECPTCRKKLVSKRSLRPDPNFDALISKLYPDRKEYEAMQERALARLSKHYNTEALQKNIEEGMKYQAQLRKMHRATNTGASATPQDEGGPGERRNKRRKRDDSSRRPTPDRESSVGDMSTSEASTSHTSKNRASEVELILKPHPDTERENSIAPVVKQTRYLKTTANATMDHLATYLSIRIKLDADEAMRNSMEQSLDTFEKVKSISSTTTTTSSSTTAAPSMEDTSTVQTSSYATTIDTHSKDPNSTGKAIDLKELGDYKIYVEQNENSGSIISLPGHLSLESVVSKYWAVKKPLELLFLVPTPLVSIIPVVPPAPVRTSEVVAPSVSRDENKKPSASTNTCVVVEASVDTLDWQVTLDTT